MNSRHIQVKLVKEPTIVGPHLEETYTPGIADQMYILDQTVLNAGKVVAGLIVLHKTSDLISWTWKEIVRSKLA